MGIVKACVLFFRAMLVSKSYLAAENLALRQQVAVLVHSNKRPKLRRRDRDPVSWRLASSLYTPGCVTNLEDVHAGVTHYRCASRSR